MIDDYAKAQALLAKMKAGLPIPVRATANLAQAARQFAEKIAVGQELAIKSVFYMGDEGRVTRLSRRKRDAEFCRPIWCRTRFVAGIYGQPSHRVAEVFCGEADLTIREHIYEVRCLRQAHP
jgi:hypothetical protein